jgi:hypothetical protein
MILCTVQLKRKMSVLGREHARLMVNSEMLFVFCDVLLNALIQCLDESWDCPTIIKAWAYNLKYIVCLMTAVQYSFSRTDADLSAARVSEGQGMPFDEDDYQPLLLLGETIGNSEKTRPNNENDGEFENMLSYKAAPDMSKEDDS